MSALETSGGKHYALAEYDAAIADFKEAYRISDEPAFLFNIAQSYRMKNECREAATFYRNYLRRSTDEKGVEPPNAAKVRGFITEMDACAAKQPAKPTTEPTTTTPPPPTATPPITSGTTPIEPVDEVPPENASARVRGRWQRRDNDRDLPGPVCGRRCDHGGPLSVSRAEVAAGYLRHARDDGLVHAERLGDVQQ